MFWDEYPDFADELSNFEKYFRNKLSSSNELITQEIKRLAEAGGKRVRPALLISVSHLGDFKKDRIWPMAAAIEMIHLATLIHDDVIDKSSLRRGVKTTHHKYTNKTAIFMGDYLFALSMEIILEEFGNEKIDGALLRQMKNTIKSIKNLCEGEVSQFERQFEKIPTFKEYLEAIKRKTALLFKASAMLGADLSGMNKYKVYKMGKLGYYMGMAFQMVDDLFDFEDKNKELGKPQRNDFTQGIYTLPIIYVYNEMDDKEKIHKYLKKPDKYSEEIKVLVHEKGGIEYTKNLAYRYKEKAQKIIGPYNDNKYGEIINWLTEKIIGRNF
ncbi:MAG TPA: polyprenyl synthetase family protein [Halanaerobiales bacterium]|nr:polyprenyl synthetase family protein [Halanaerobiales bacterium]